MTLHEENAKALPLGITSHMQAGKQLPENQPYQRDLNVDARWI